MVVAVNKLKKRIEGKYLVVGNTVKVEVTGLPTETHSTC